MRRDPLDIPTPYEFGIDGAEPDRPFRSDDLRCPICGGSRFHRDRVRPVPAEIAGTIAFEVAACLHCRHVLWFVAAMPDAAPWAT